MKRQSERDGSPIRASGKRPRDRDRERGREREVGSRREEGPADSSNRSSRYRKNSGERGKNRTGGVTRSGSRDRFTSRRDERSGGGGDSSNHRSQHQPEQPPSRTQSRLAKPAKPEPPLTTTAAGEYKTLLLSGLGAQVLADAQLEDAILRQFGKYGDISVKISHTPELGRVAYVNFRHPQDAKDARHSKGGRLMLYDRPVNVEPVFLQSRSRTPPEPAYVPTHGYQYKPRSLSPRLPRHTAFALEVVGLSRERERALEYYGMHDERGRPYSISVPEEDRMPEDDVRATRNLFIGNLDPAITELELRRAFEKYGLIEEVVIKHPQGAGGMYAFLKFQNLDMAHRAKVAMSGQIIGRNAIKIGYGKVNPTTRLWVGGLGPSTSLAALAREFDRFGSIKTIDYVKGDNFAYIQYESLDAAQAACSQMRGYPLGGPDRRLRVDFAKTEENRYPQQYQPTLLPAHYELLPESYSRHRNLEQDLRVRDRTPPHLLYSDRDRIFTEGTWTSPTKASERRNNLENYTRVARSRSGEHWGSDGERNVSKPWEERRKRRSLSGDRGKPPLLPFDDKIRTKTVVQTAERSPDRARKENHVSQALPERDQHSPLQNNNNKHVAEDRKRPSTPESSQHKKRESERNHRTTEASPKRAPELKSETKKPKSLLEYAMSLPLAWVGHLVLKNSCFHTSMHFLEGDSGLPNILLKDHKTGNDLTQLKIAQRLRLDQPKLDEVTRRIKQGTPGGYAVLLAVQSFVGTNAVAASIAESGLQRRLLRNLVSYLKQKQAAGVISLPVGGAKGRDGTGMLYAFPPCEFSQQYLQAAIRTLGNLEEEHMVMVIVKDSA